MALTDWETQQNQGGFQSGVFHGGESQLLPMPKTITFGSANCVHATQSSSAFGGNYNNRGLDNIYDVDGGYAYTTTSHFIYSNKNGTTKFIITAPSGCSFISHSHYFIFHKELNKIYAVGYLKSGGGYKYFKVGISARSLQLSNELFNGIHFKFGILENNKIFHVISINGGSQAQSHYIDFNTLTRTGRNYNGVGSRIRSSSNQNYRETYGAAVFNGSITICGNQILQSSQGANDVTSVMFAVNKDLDMNSAKSNKSHMRTMHNACQNMWLGPLFQASKDLFVAYGTSAIYTNHDYSHGAGSRYYTRSDLESWVSDCIFAETGFRIGGN